MKNILITGAARGLGKELKDTLIKEGYFIFGTTRTPKATCNSDNCQFFYLDLSAKRSIDQLVDYFIQSNITIDVLIHNAGVAYLDPIDVLSCDEIENIFKINFFGPIYLTKKLLPHLKKNSKTNIIFISSIVSTDHWPYLGTYAASKSALEAAAFEWAVLLRRWNIFISVIQPNPLQTDMQIMRSKNAMHSPYPELTNRTLKWEKIQDACNVVLNIINESSPKFQYQTGPESEKTVNAFLKKDVYEKSLKKYYNQFTYSTKL